MAKGGRQPTWRDSSFLTLWLGAVALVFIGVSELVLWHVLLRAFVATSVATAALYGLDKALAQASARRVPEWVLIAAALLGGSPGAVVGMYAFRHKTRKTAFQAWLALVLIIQVGFLGLWISQRP